MGCNCSGGGVATSPTPNPYNAQINNINEPCLLTGQIIQTWLNLLNCVKTNNKQDLINLAMAQVNSYLGILQSAINYPDNYCYFMPQLTTFQNTILPKIISYVSECME